jgi:hypothetical protein
VQRHVEMNAPYALYYEAAVVRNMVIMMVIKACTILIVEQDCDWHDATTHPTKSFLKQHNLKG